jgi:cell division protein FtsB
MSEMREFYIDPVGIGVRAFQKDPANIRVISYESYEQAQARIKELEAELKTVLEIGVEGQRKINDQAWEKNKKLEQKVKILEEGLELIGFALPPNALSMKARDALNRARGLK